MDKNVYIHKIEQTMSINMQEKAEECPIYKFQTVINGKYKLRILWDLKDGPRRYGQIQKGLLRGEPGTGEIAPRVLSRELKQLTELGYISRKDYGQIPPKVEYSLTKQGHEIIPVIDTIHAWGLGQL